MPERQTKPDQQPTYQNNKQHHIQNRHAATTNRINAFAAFVFCLLAQFS
jgi:hypothetical protein